MIKLPANTTRVTPQGENWFFGYYDIPGFDWEGKRHLCLNVPFMDRLQVRGDKAQIYAIDLSSGARTYIDETSAWNFQQSCMLQWHPTQPDTVIYNVRCQDSSYPMSTKCGYGAIVKSLSTGEILRLDRPVANVARTGDLAVSINFDRMYDFRPGYGYAGQRDASYDIPHCAEDGIFIVDMKTGESKMIVSLEHIWDFVGGYFKGQDQKICINHITFNTDGTRIVFLVRNFYKADGAWRTALLTCDTQGKELFLLSDFAMASHYNWRDENVIAFYSDGRELGDMGPQLYELDDLAHTGRAIDPSFFKRDGHNSYSPDLQWMLYDSYPIDGYRELYLYDLVSMRGGLLGTYWVKPGCDGDIRCDLHPLWSPGGDIISFDSVHEGYRALYLMDTREAKQALRG